MDKITRRRFGQLAISAAVFLDYLEQLEGRAAQPQVLRVKDVNWKQLKINVNGNDHTITVDTRTSLLDLLRNNLKLTGSKKGCDHGQCGACTVLINGTRIKSCLSLAVMHNGDQITTIEGLEQNGQLHPMQEAFIEHDGFQCGYCTPGQIMSAVGMLKEPCGKSDAEVRECMSGNICRCGAYPFIVAAIQDVRKGV
jgi:xanthine dehydrogenase YagT iron-sulfur-binding subunit